MRVFRTILGMLLLTVGLPTLLAGAAFWVAMQHRDPDGAFTGDLQRVATSGYAVVVDDFDGLLAKDAPFARLSDTRLRLTAESGDAPAFLGIAPAADVSRYLADVPQIAVASIDLGTGALPVTFDLRPGTVAPEQLPDRQTFWLESGLGTLNWKPAALRNTDYSLVVMNPAAQPGVRLEATAAVVPAWLNQVTWALLILGSMLLMIGMIVLGWPSRRREVVYIVEPSQVPDLMQAIGAPLPLSRTGGGRHAGTHRPRTLADSQPRSRPPAWPPSSSSAGRDPVIPLPAAPVSGAETSTIPAAAHTPTSAAAAPVAAAASPAPGEPLSLIAGEPAPESPGESAPVGSSTDPLFGRLADRPGRRRPAPQPTDLPIFQASAVGAWVAETAAVRAREAEALAEAALSSARKGPVEASKPDTAAVTTPAPDGGDVAVADNATIPADAEPARMKTAPKAGSPAAATAKSGSSTGDAAKAGSSAADVAKAGSAAAAVAKSGSAAADVAKAGSLAGAVAKSDSPVADVAKAGSSAAAVAKSGSPAAAVAKSGSPAADVAKAGSPVADVVANRPTPAVPAAAAPAGKKAGSDAAGAAPVEAVPGRNLAAGAPAAGSAGRPATAAKSEEPNVIAAVAARLQPVSGIAAQAPAEPTTPRTDVATPGPSAPMEAAAKAGPAAPRVAEVKAKEVTPSGGDSVPAVSGETAGSTAAKAARPAAVTPRNALFGGASTQGWAATGLTRADSGRIGLPKPSAKDAAPAPGVRPADEKPVTREEPAPTGTATGASPAAGARPPAQAPKPDPTRPASATPARPAATTKTPPPAGTAAGTAGSAAPAQSTGPSRSGGQGTSAAPHHVAPATPGSAGKAATPPPAGARTAAPAPSGAKTGAPAPSAASTGAPATSGGKAPTSAPAGGKPATVAPSGAKPTTPASPAVKAAAAPPTAVKSATPPAAVKAATPAGAVRSTTPTPTRPAPTEPKPTPPTSPSLPRPAVPGPSRPTDPDREPSPAGRGPAVIRSATPAAPRSAAAAEPRRDVQPSPTRPVNPTGAIADAARPAPKTDPRIAEQRNAGLRPMAEPAKTTTGSQPATAGTQRTTTGSQPATAGTQRTTTGSQPATAGTQRTTAGTQRTTAGSQSATAGTQPADQAGAQAANAKAEADGKPATRLSDYKAEVAELLGGDAAARPRPRGPARAPRRPPPGRRRRNTRS
ncbi:hypothetical protein, partial [Actinoplanes sp. NPDC005259]|uniref:hypothetical protein n=1 Tax=Actinoplanes sp. NPDC005259 TaxID=3154674 RepID=UPI0033AC293C